MKPWEKQKKKDQQSKEKQAQKDQQSKERQAHKDQQAETKETETHLQREEKRLQQEAKRMQQEEDRMRGRPQIEERTKSKEKADSEHHTELTHEDVGAVQLGGDDASRSSSNNGPYGNYDFSRSAIMNQAEPDEQASYTTEMRARTAVYGHQWGVLDDSFAESHARRYTRVLAADCLWMPHEHENLARSMLHFLSDSPDARVYVIAGFHTGRAKVAPFFEETVPEVGLEVESIYEMNAEGTRRAWAMERDGGREDVTERKKWCMLARLRRRR